MRPEEDRNGGGPGAGAARDPGLSQLSRRARRRPRPRRAGLPRPRLWAGLPGPPGDPRAADRRGPSPRRLVIFDDFRLEDRSALATADPILRRLAEAGGRGRGGAARLPGAPTRPPRARP